MAKQRPPNVGIELEARIQRLFMCQGAFAERGLFIRAAKGESRLVTDIDVVAHDYSINFHHRRIYAECKGGRNVSTLDRVVWVRGVKEIIGADFAYLVLDHCDTSSVSFARGQDVEILQLSGIQALESALKIGGDFWPGRANLSAYLPIEREITHRIQSKGVDHVSNWLTRAAEVWRDASHLAFSYGRLNSLISTLELIGQQTKGTEFVASDVILIKYAISALVVRLGQYIMFSASDTLGMTKTEREDYLKERLTVGGQGVEQTRRILESSIKLVKARLEQHHIQAPVSWDIEHMLLAPPYALPFATVVERAIADGEFARTLPLSTELRLFGYGGKEEQGGRFLARIRGGLDLVGLIRGFVIQSLGIDSSYCEGMAGQVDRTNTVTIKSGEKSLFGLHEGEKS